MKKIKRTKSGYFEFPKKGEKKERERETHNASTTFPSIKLEWKQCEEGKKVIEVTNRPMKMLTKLEYEESKKFLNDFEVECISDEWYRIFSPNFDWTIKIQQKDGFDYHVFSNEKTGNKFRIPEDKILRNKHIYKDTVSVPVSTHKY